MAKQIIYWITTLVITLELVMGGLADVMHASSVAQVMDHLAYPRYFMSILGFWKLLAAAAILAPGLPRLKEWAYAGILFELTGAAASHLAARDSVGNMLVPLAFLMVSMISWDMRPPSRVLGRIWQGSGSYRPAARPDLRVGR
jgi:hypothetical protein